MNQYALVVLMELVLHQGIVIVKVDGMEQHVLNQLVILDVFMATVPPQTLVRVGIIFNGRVNFVTFQFVKKIV